MSSESAVCPAGSPVRTKSRRSVACDPCRVRKVKCSGDLPCQACRAMDRPQACRMRVKARPTRTPAKSLSLLDLSPTASAPPSPQALRPATTSKAALQVLDTNVGSAHTVVAAIEQLAVEWATSRGLDPSFVRYIDCDTLLLKPMSNPSPAHSHRSSAIESTLMSFYVTTSPHHLDFINRNRILALFGRYTQLPHTLGEDQIALVQAALCRSADLKAFTMEEGEAKSAMQRLAGDYYRRAAANIELWTRPTLHAASALHYLVTYAAGRGGKEETSNLMKQMAWQIRQLGLVKRETAMLYEADDQVERMLLALVYIERSVDNVHRSFTANPMAGGVGRIVRIVLRSELMKSMATTLLDAQPNILWPEIDWDFTGTALVSTTSLQIMRFEAEFLALTRPEDTRDVESVLHIENRWDSFRKSVQQVHMGEKDTIKHGFLGWALVRVSWLGIMLRVSTIRHPLLASSSLSVLARSASCILRVYWDLAQSNNLEPCWIQLQRIVSCAQLVLSTCDEGHMHPTEAKDLLDMAIEIIRQHRTVCSASDDLAKGFEAAKTTLLASLGMLPTEQHAQRGSSVTTAVLQSQESEILNPLTVSLTMPWDTAGLDWPFANNFTADDFLQAELPDLATGTMGNGGMSIPGSSFDSAGVGIFEGDQTDLQWVFNDHISQA